MTETEKVVDVSGRIVDKSLKEGKKGNYWEFMIETDGEEHKWRWFTSNDAKGHETAENLHKGDTIKGTGVLNETTYNGNPVTFRNIRGIFKEELQEEQVNPTPSKPQEKEVSSSPTAPSINGAEFGLATHLAQRTLSALDREYRAETFWTEYEMLVQTFFSKNKQIKDKIERGMK